MNSSILYQYESLNEEVRDLKAEVDRLDRKMQQPVADTASGSTVNTPYTKVTYIITGVPYDRRQLDRLRHKLAAKAGLLLQLREQIEDELDTVQDSEMRRIIRYRCIERMTWPRVARRMGWHDEQMPRRKFTKFIKMTEMTEKP